MTYTAESPVKYAGLGFQDSGGTNDGKEMQMVEVGSSDVSPGTNDMLTTSEKGLPSV